MNENKPCANPENDPDDWYISRDGRQYPDDELVTEAQVMAHLNEVDPHGTRSTAEIESVWDSLEAVAVKDALRRRRHAKDKCHTECYFRLQCLDKALEDVTPATHGTWGGHYEEELREIRREVARRKRARQR